MQSKGRRRRLAERTTEVLTVLMIVAVFASFIAVHPVSAFRSGGGGGAITQPILIATPTGGSAFTYAVSGCDVYPTTGTSGESENFYVDPSCSLTITMPPAGTNTRYVFSFYDSWASTTSVVTCSSGTCGPFSPTAFYQLENTYEVTPASPTTWDATLSSYSVLVTGTQAGSPPPWSDGCTITISSGGGSAYCDGWFDYDTTVSFPATLAENVPNIQWTGMAPLSFTDKTGGNTRTVDYYKQYDLSFAQSGLDSSAQGTIVSVTVGSNPAVKLDWASTFPYDFGYFNAGTTITYTFSSKVSSSNPGEQFVLTTPSPTPASGFTLSGATTVTGTYHTQYKVTFSLPNGLGSDATSVVLIVNSTNHYYAGFPVNVWVWPNSGTTFSFNSPVTGGTGIRYIFQSSSVLSPLTGLTGPVTITSTYSAQYKVTFSLPNGLGSDATSVVLIVNSTNHYYAGFPVNVWVWPNSGTTFSFNSPVTGGTGIRYIFQSSSVLSPLTGLTGPVTITSTYSAQYKVTFSLPNGLGSDATSVVLIVNSTNHYYAGFPVNVWVWPNSGTTFSFNSPVTGGTGIRYIFQSSSVLSPLTGLTGPVTITSTYSAQYKVTFSLPNGLGSDATSVVLIVNSTNHYYAGFPVNVWVWPNSGTTFSFNSPVTGGTGIRYIFQSSSVLSPLTGLTGPVTITSTYSAQYKVTFSLPNGLGSDATSVVLIVNSTNHYYAGFPVNVWVWPNSGTTFSFNSPVTGGTGIRYIFQSSSVLSPLTGLTGPVTITSTYSAQYKVTFHQTGSVSSVSVAWDFGNGTSGSTDAPFSLWADSTTTSITYTYPSPVAGAPGVQYSLVSVSPESSYTISNGPVTVTGTYQIQYDLSFAQSNLDSSAQGTIVSVTVGSNPAVNLDWASTFPYDFGYVNAGTTITYTFTSQVASSNPGEQFVLTTPAPSPTSGFSLSEATTVTGTYQIQYDLSFAQSNLDSSAQGTIVSVTVGSNPAVNLDWASTFPYDFGYVNAGTTITYTFTSQVASSNPGEQFVLTTPAPSPTSGFSLSEATTVTGTYQIQYMLTVSVSPPRAGSVSVSTGFVDYGAFVSITATPKAGFLFGSWATMGVSCAGGASSNPCTFNMPDNPASVTANFQTPTMLVLRCSPHSGTVGVSESCTAYVVNKDLIYYAKVTGTVTFTGTLPPGMPTSCPLAGGMSISSSCTVSWTPAPGTERSYHITASYSGDPTHVSSSGSTALTIGKRSVSVSVACSGPYRQGAATTCTVTVKDKSPGTLITPIGTVAFSGSGKGVFSSMSCTLVSGVPGTASCQVTLTPTSKGSYTVSVRYGGDTDHYPGTASTAFKAT